MKQLKIFLFSLLFATTLLGQGRDFLVDAQWLYEAKESVNDLVILEVRYYPHRYYTVGHIKGAVQVQRFKDLGNNFANPIMRFPPKEEFQKTLRSWGVNDGSTIVIYDDSSTVLTSRLYAMLELYGFAMERVKILNGGTMEWDGMYGELTKEPSSPKPGNVTIKKLNPDMVVEWTDVYDKVLSNRDPSIVLVDARPFDMYTGDVISHSIQGGHIPGAINIVSMDGTEGGIQKWRDKATIKEMYKGIAKDKTIYIYCHDGFRMSLGWLQLKSLGYKDIRFLNGGWSEWDRAMTLPVIKGEEPYDADYAL